MPYTLAIEFIAVFSRMEYALKATKGYALGDEGKVEAAWDKFANEINEKLINIKEEELIYARAYLLNNPPRKQTLQNGEVCFREQVVDSNQREAQQLIRFIRTIRNNLFHGGKYMPNGETEEGRNKELVAASLEILKSCISLNEKVKLNYIF